MLPSYIPRSIPPALLSFALGSQSALSMAPFNMWYLLFLGLGGLYFTLANSPSNKHAFLYGWSFAFGYFLFGLSWIGQALLVDGNPYQWAWPLAISGLPFILAPFTACACFLSKRYFHLNTIPGFVFFVATISLFEWLRGHMFTGFPWNLYGYTWFDILPLIQVASIDSVYLLTFLTILWMTFPGFLLTLIQNTNAEQSKTHTVSLSILCFVVLLSFISAYAYGYNRIKRYNALPEYETPDNTTVLRIVHPYIPQDQKWTHSKTIEHFFRFLRGSYYTENTDPKLSHNAQTILVWPETALHPSVYNDAASRDLLSKALQSYPGTTTLLTGVLRQNSDGSYYNSMVNLSSHFGDGDTYNKQHLVPFGEYIPFGHIIPVRAINRFSGFKSGAGNTVLSLEPSHSYRPLICYESIFPGEVLKNNEPRPDILVNITNDAWYVGTHGPAQHYAHAALRAVETGIPLVRSANGGISAMITPTGEAIYSSTLKEDSSPLLQLPPSFFTVSQTLMFKNQVFFLLILAGVITAVILKKAKFYNK